MEAHVWHTSADAYWFKWGMRRFPWIEFGEASAGESILKIPM